jgi:nitrate reductase gamma subunit
MTLLDFARGPALQIAFVVFVFGVLWRLLSLLLLPWARDRSVARKRGGSVIVGVARGFWRHTWPDKHVKVPRFTMVNSYIFHLGLFVIVFGLAQHILFIRGLIGISWPGLPTSVISIVSVVTLASLVTALVRRLASPVTRLISTSNDYITWIVTTLPIVTGLVAVAHLWEPYEMLLAIHLLSVALLLIWFPFGKLMHAFLLFLTRSETGVFYSRRGAEI